MESVLCDGMVERWARFPLSMAPKAIVGKGSHLTSKKHNIWPSPVMDLTSYGCSGGKALGNIQLEMTKRIKKTK